MIDAKPLVLAALMKVEGFGGRVHPSFPDTFNKLPCASYYEISNIPNAAADDDEYLSEITFVVDIWAHGAEEVGKLAIEANSEIKKAGFIREFAADVNDPDGTIRHKTMRYRLIK